MKIAEYNDMMSYLTRQNFNSGTEKPRTVSDLIKSKDIVTGDKYKPKNPKLIQSIRAFEEKYGFRKKESNGGPQIIPPSKPAEDPLEVFKKQADLFLQGSFGSSDKTFFNNLIEQEYDKALDAGVLPEEAISFLKERSEMYRKLAEEGRMQGEPATLGPSYGRENKAIGGGVIEGKDLGTREGFETSKIKTKKFKFPKKFYNRKTKKVETVYSDKPPPTDTSGQKAFVKAALDKSEAAYKKFEDKFGKELLDKMAKEKYGKNFRDLDKNKELKFFKTQLNKYDDFILENERYPNTSEAYRIGLDQAGKRGRISLMTDEIKDFIRNTYSSGEGGSKYISDKLAEPPYNFKVDDSTIRRFITDEIDADRLERVTKFKTQEPDPDLPKDRYNKIRKVTERDLRGFTVGRTGTEVLAPEGSKYKISFKAAKNPETSKVPLIYQGTKYYKTKAQANKALAGYKKFSKDLIKQGKANKGLREIILEEVSDPTIEAEITRLKQGEDLATAHRLSYKQVKKLGELYNILNLGVEAPGINSGAIRRFENKLDNLYKEQNNLIRTARRSTNKGLEIPKNIQERIDNVNKEISTVVDLTNQRVQGVLVDAKTLKPYTYGINYIKTYGMGFLDNKPVKDITDEDLKVVEDNLKFQMDREKKLAKGTESFLRDRQELLKYTKELSKPGFLSKIPARLRPIALGTGFLIAGTIPSRAGETNTLPPGILPQGSPGQINPEDKSFVEEYPLLTGAAGVAGTGGALAATKLTKPTSEFFKKPRRFAKELAKMPLRAIGSVPTSLYLSGSQFANINPFSDEFGKLKEDPNLMIAGADLLLPELGKRVKGSGTGIMSKFGRGLLNPFQYLEGLGKYGRLGRVAAMGARIPTLMTPVGLTMAGAGAIKKLYDEEMKEKARVEAMSPEDRESYLQEKKDTEELMSRASAAYGGRMGFADGPEDPSKRTFMKILGGIASLPVIGRFFDIAKESKVAKQLFTEIQQLKNTQTQMPEWFPTFLNKFRKEGTAENMFKKKKIPVSEQEFNEAIKSGKGEGYYADPRTPEYIAKNPDHIPYFKLDDTEELVGTTYTNKKFPGVNVDDFDGEVNINFQNDYGQEVIIQYVKPGAKGLDTGRPDKVTAGIAEVEVKPKGDFSAVDQEVYLTDPDGGYDTNPVVVNSLDDMLEGTTRKMEEYATGKKVKKLSKGEEKIIQADIEADSLKDYYED